MGYYEFPHTRNYDTDLGYIIKKLKELEINSATKEEVAQIELLIEKIKNGDYVDLYLDSIKNYIDDNLIEMVRKLVQFVFFGISDDGYFVSYIPESWNDITFNTSNYDIDTPDLDFGKLLLSY